MFHFAVEIDFEGEGCGVKNGAAISALAQMPLNLASYLRRESSFQIFANQPDCRFARYAHDSTFRELGFYLGNL